MIRILLPILAFCCLSGYKPIPVQEINLDPLSGNDLNAIVGQWEGTATSADEQTRVSLELRLNKRILSASISLMDMGVMGWPAKDVQFTAGELTLRFPADDSEQIFKLRLVENAADKSILEGSWRDTRLEELAGISLVKKKTVPLYTSTPVQIDGPAGTLSAELVLPRGEGPFPGVVFLHGSGPQPKDTNRFSAFALAEFGIASIIFDKRGVGGSESNWQGADFEDLARDGIAVGAYFSGLEQISNVGFFGHSQGGWIGPLAASLWDKTAFVISSAGPAVSPAREAQWSFIYNAISAGAGEEDVRLIRQLVEHWHEGLRTNEWDAYKQSLAEAVERPWYQSSELPYLQYPPEPEHLKYYLPFMDYDPIPVLTKLEVPLLALLTPDDESIDAVETAYILKEIKESGRDIQIKMYPGYNHGFRKLGAKGPIRWPGFPEDYFKLQSEFIKGSTTPNKR